MTPRSRAIWRSTRRLWGELVSIATAATQLAEIITAAGVSTSADPDQLVIPGGYLVVDRLDANRLDGDTIEATFRLYLLAGDLPIPAVLDELGKLYRLAKHFASGPAEFVQLALPNYASNGLPSLYLTIPTEITEE